MIDRLWKFTALVVDSETHEGKPAAKLFRRSSCKELAIDVQGMQLEKVQVDGMQDDDELDAAYVIRMERDQLHNLIDQYQEVDGQQGYDFGPEMDFLCAAEKNSSETDEILIICIVLDDDTHYEGDE